MIPSAGLGLMCPVVSVTAKRRNPGSPPAMGRIGTMRPDAFTRDTRSLARARRVSISLSSRRRTEVSIAVEDAGMRAGRFGER